MADISITVANCKKVAGASVNSGRVAGETVTAGMPVYIKTADDKLWKSQSDGTAEEATVYGVALHAALADQPLAVLIGGPTTIGGTVVAGTIYVVSATAGGICPWADLVSTNKVSIVGYASTGAIIVVGPLVTGVAIP